MKRLAFLIVITALLTSCQQGGDRPEYVGQVNDVRISYEQYIASVRRAFESYQLQRDAWPSESERKALTDEAWQSIIRSVVLADLYYDYGVVVSQQEVLDSLLANPPQIVKDSRFLQIDGEFSPALYENALNTGEPVDLDWLKLRYYNSILPLGKLRKAVLDDMRVSEAELRSEYDTRYGVATVDLVAVPLASIPEPRVTQPEIRDWYEAHRDSFLLAPTCDLQWVKFPVVPSRDDSLVAKAAIDSVYVRLGEGESFASLARQFSESSSAVLGGDIGYKPIEELPPMIERQLAGGLWQMHTRPFQQDGAWVIYRPMKKTRNLVKLQEIVIRPRASRETLTEVLSEVRLFSELTGDIGMRRAADEFGFEVLSKSDANLDDPNLPELGESPRVVGIALSSKPGTILEPMYHDDLSCYLLFQVVDSHPGGILPLHQVSDEIAARLRDERRTQDAVAIARELAKNDNPFASARARGYEVISLTDFHYSTQLLGEWREELNRAILRQKPGGWIVSPFTDDYAWVANTRSFTPPDPAGFSAVRASLREQVLERMREGYFERWLQERYDEAKVRDWRPTLPMFQ